MEDRQLPLILFLADLVEGQLVEILKQPGSVERVAFLGAEDVDAWDGQTGQLVSARRFNVVERHA